MAIDGNPVQKHSNDSIASLACGIIGTFFGALAPMFFVSLVLGIVAIRYGIKGRKKQFGHKMATYGLLLGTLSLTLGIMWSVIIASNPV